MEVFALLDDLGGATRGEARSRVYTDFCHQHVAPTPSALEATWQAADADLRRGLHAVLLADYEWGAALHGVPAAAGGVGHSAIGGLRVLMFGRMDMWNSRQADDWLCRLDGGCESPSPAGVMDLAEDVDDAAFNQAIAAIHRAIRAGETYQVNYTYRWQGQAFGSPVALYRRLRARQPVGYGAFIALPTAGAAVRHVLSLSPELFLRHEAGTLTARPMKGTAARALSDPVADEAAAEWLRADIKNRAENLMIVDLLRNDLGRVAESGSVRVPALFSVEPYSTVWQMTSTVQATVRRDVGMPELLRAGFPCGSITGAPKHHTMELIRALEGAPRGLYCGAIGWVEPAMEGRALGDLCLSVAIRTLTLGEPRAGLAPLRFGVGAGIVLDSEAAGERAECRLKARFLSTLDPGFALIETMRYGPGRGVPLWSRHMQRLSRSAARLGFAFDGARFAKEFNALAARLEADADADAGAGLTDWRVRASLHADGRIDWHHAHLGELPAGQVRLIWSGDLLPLEAPLALHKTTLRGHYDRGVRQAEAAGAFDSLFVREDGAVLEGGRSSLFVQLDGRWWTPPLADGVLAGVMRAELLADPRWNAAERRLMREDVARAEAIVVCNALRGALPATLA